MMYEPVHHDEVEIDPYSYSQIEQTQQASQSQGDAVEEWNENLWGILKPAHYLLARIYLTKDKNLVTIGRGHESNVVLPHLKISQRHCILSYDPNQNKDTSVTVHDKSSNGTWINGKKVGRGRSAFLKDGSDIAFGQWSDKNSAENYRYVFRFMANGPPESGLHKYYDVGHELGRGSFATVKRAVCRADGRQHAIKMISRTRMRADGENAIAIFMREISILERLHHPNICELKESFREDDDVILVLEFIDGGDLLDHVLSRNGLSEDEVRRLTFQLCKALKYMHAKGIAHRDLKPENILLTRDNPPNLKLADFGLAKAVDSMTKFKTMCGTPMYLAPEVILRDVQESYSHVVDSWSTGVITFAMLANCNPFVDDDASVISVRFRSRYVDWGLLDSRGVSTECRRFIERLIEENPAERMTCAEALRHPWLLPLSENDPEALSDTLDDSFISIRANAGSFLDDEIATPQVNLPPSLPSASVASVVSQSAGISTDFEHIRMEDAIPSPVSATTAVPDDQPEPEARSVVPPTTRGQGRKLERHHMEVAERDDEGRLTSFRAFPDSPLNAELSYVEENDGNSRGLKRKKRSDSLTIDSAEPANGAHNGKNGADEDRSIVALTPVTENGDASNANADEPPQNGNARKKATTDPTPEQQDLTSDRGAPAKRTRALPVDVPV